MKNFRIRNSYFYFVLILTILSICSVKTKNLKIFEQSFLFAVSFLNLSNLPILVYYYENLS
jgi:hypothetical protein